MNVVTRKSLIRVSGLRDKILKYFEAPNSSMDLYSDPDFSEYDKEEIRTVLMSLVDSGLIMRLRGSGKGTFYKTAQDGEILLNALSGYKLAEA